MAEVTRRTRHRHSYLIRRNTKVCPCRMVLHLRHHTRHTCHHPCRQRTIHTLRCHIRRKVYKLKSFINRTTYSEKEIVCVFIAFTHMGVSKTFIDFQEDIILINLCHKLRMAVTRHYHVTAVLRHRLVKTHGKDYKYVATLLSIYAVNLCINRANHNIISKY